MQPSPDDHERRRLDRLVDRLQQRLPGRLARTMAWLVSPAAIFVRLPLALLFIAGGFLGFLPILGFWMLPLGILLIAIDVPFVRRWVVRVWPKIEARWRLWRSRRSNAA